MHKFWALCCLFCVCSGLFAAQTSIREDDSEYLKQRREAAAAYKLRRAQFQAPEGYDEAAKTRLDEILALLEHGEHAVALKLAKRSYEDDFPYSIHTAKMLHTYIRCYLPEFKEENKKHKLNTGRIYNRLNDLWLRFPDYGGMREAFEQVLAAAEVIQNTGTIIDVHAETIEEAIKRSRGLYLNSALRLYQFLEDNGDKHNIAPRASLGIARIYLIQGISDPRKLFMARSKYRQFIERYPRHSLVFDCLIERAYSHLIAYRGDKYDVGVLIEAAYILKQSELYAGQNQKNIDLIAKLRALIRRSHQARDFQVASWYQEKGHTESAIYYYREVVKRDPNSNKGRDAARIITELSAADSDKSDE